MSLCIRHGGSFIATDCIGCSLEAQIKGLKAQLTEARAAEPDGVREALRLLKHVRECEYCFGDICSEAALIVADAGDRALGAVVKWEPDGLREALERARIALSMHDDCVICREVVEEASRALGVADRQDDPYEYEGYGHAMRDTERVADRQDKSSEPRHDEACRNSPESPCDCGADSPSEETT